MVMELYEREYMVRGLGYLKSSDIEKSSSAPRQRHPDPGRRAGSREYRAGGPPGDRRP